MKQQRRVFLKVIAAGPFVGCAASPGEESPGGMGGTPAAGGTFVNLSGASSSVAGTQASSGGTTSSTGGTFTTNGGTFVNSGGTFVSGGTFGGPASGGASVGGASAGGASAGTGAVVTPKPGVVVTNMANVPVGAFGIAGGLFFLGRDADGLFAMSMQCTHKGCTVNMDGNQLLCPCHQARFDLDGNVLGGPAPTPLPHFAVHVDSAGNISVDKFTVVSAQARTPV